MIRIGIGVKKVLVTRERTTQAPLSQHDPWDGVKLSGQQLVPVAWASCYILLIPNIFVKQSCQQLCENWKVLIAESQSVTVSRLYQFLVSISKKLSQYWRRKIWPRKKVPVSVSKDLVSNNSHAFGNKHLVSKRNEAD